jgi:glycosyltransferase involved in cell wall biosynthesis
MPSIEIGGVEKNLFLIANYLIKKKINITIITSNKTHISSINKNIRIVSLKSNFFLKRKKYVKYFICLVLLTIEYFKNKNITVFAFQANIYAIILCKLLGIKIITRSNTSPNGWSKNIIKRIIFKFILKYADLIIVNSLYFKRQMSFVFNVKTKLIYNPLNKYEILRTKRKKFYLKKNVTKVINIGRFTEQKDQITLLKAIKLLIKRDNRFFFTIIGRGYLENKLKNYISNNNLGKYIKIITKCSKPYGYIKDSNIFILTSKFEGLPNVLLEAMSLKKYIISTDCPTGPKEILNNGEYGDLIKVGNYKSIADLLFNYNKRKKIISKMIKLGYKSLNKYDYKINCEKYYSSIKNYL